MAAGVLTKSKLREIAARVSPLGFLDHKDYLRTVYDELKAQVGRYSYIRFTEDLGMGACNAAYLIVSGERPLSDKAAAKIVRALGLSGAERRYFEQLVAYALASDPGEREKIFANLLQLKTKTLPSDLDKQQLAFFSRWYHAAILELLALPGAEDSPEWIATHLNPPVTPAKVRASLQLLVKLGYAEHNKERGRLMPRQARLSTGSEAYGMAIASFHQQMIDLAKAALTSIDAEHRDISGVTIKIPSHMKAELKKELAEFRQKLLKLSEVDDESDEIVQVNLQMFPLTRKPIRKRQRKDEAS